MTSRELSKYKKLEFILRVFGGSLVLSIFVTLFSLWLIKDWGPLSGWTGVGPWMQGRNHDYADIWEYTGFYVFKNLSFSPLPSLDLLNNQVFYPYGVNNVFQAWGLERDLLYALLFSRYGTGPWLQIYFLASLVLTAIGTFFLLLKDYRWKRAIAVAFMVSFGNFYAIFKYPHHFNICIHHWATLGIIVDFLLVRRIYLRQSVDLPLILGRAALLMLVLGLDLGYVAGFSLMSFSVSFIVVLACRRNVLSHAISENSKNQLKKWKEDFSHKPLTCLFLTAVTLIAAYLYLPLIFQIASEAKAYSASISSKSFWVNPFRLFLPILSIFNDPTSFQEYFFQDQQEALFDGSPGLFLVLLAGIGLSHARDSLMMFAPILAILSLCLFYFPQGLLQWSSLGNLSLSCIVIASLFIARSRRRLQIGLMIFFFLLFWFFQEAFMLPTLKLFPWFSFNRVGGRSTEFYPVFLSLLALHVDWKQMLMPKQRFYLGVLSCLAVVEITTAYSLRSAYQNPEPLTPSFMNYMKVVQEQPGEAILDWPFCVKGNNSPSLCPYNRFNSGIFTLRRFHGKKVMGQNFGRLHPSQVEPYVKAGWDQLLVPNEEQTRQKRCFSPREWAFFTDFYTFNDFAGINLYTDRLPETCVASFYQKFGAPVVQTQVPGAGNVAFLPKSAALIKQTNPDLGKALKLSSFLE